MRNRNKRCALNHNQLTWKFCEIQCPLSAFTDIFFFPQYHNVLCRRRRLRILMRLMGRYTNENISIWNTQHRANINIETFQSHLFASQQMNYLCLWIFHFTLIKDIFFLEYNDESIHYLCKLRELDGFEKRDRESERKKE